MNADWNSFRFFRRAEFDSPDVLGSGANMRQEFMLMLELAREISKVPYHINSGYRTEAHNAKVGGANESAHTKGWAADIRAADSRTRCQVLCGLVKAGFTRIGIAKTFIHADCDPTLPAGVAWLY